MSSTYDISARQGDTWDGASFTIRVNGIIKNLTGAVVEVLVSDNYDTLLPAILSVTVTNAVGGIFQINPQIIPLSRGVYFYNIKISFPDGTVKTWISGHIRIT